MVSCPLVAASTHQVPYSLLSTSNRDNASRWQTATIILRILIETRQDTRYDPSPHYLFRAQVIRRTFRPSNLQVGHRSHDQAPPKEQLPFALPLNFLPSRAGNLKDKNVVLLEWRVYHAVLVGKQDMRRSAPEERRVEDFFGLEQSSDVSRRLRETTSVEVKATISSYIVVNLTTFVACLGGSASGEGFVRGQPTLHDRGRRTDRSNTESWSTAT